MKHILIATAAAIGLSAAPVAAQKQGGLVNVNVSDISVDLNEVISDNNINVQAPIGAIVQVPIGVAANICDVSAAVLAQNRDTGDAACTATNETTSDAELMTLARSLQRK